MGATRGSATNRDASSLAGHVLHVADAEVCARFGPMLRQALWALDESGLRISLLTNDADLVGELDATAVECHQVQHLTGWRAWRLGGYLSVRISPPPTLAHLWGTGSLGWVERWARRVGVPLLIHALGAGEVERLVRRGLGASERVAVASEALAAPLRQSFPLATERWQTVPPGVALAVQHARQRPGARTLGVLCVTRLDETHGPEVLIDALAQLRRDQHDVQVAVLGDGPGVGKVWQRIRARRVQDHCVVINEPKLWEKALPDADVCVVPAGRRELWLAPLLAMGLGKVVLASRDQLAEWFIEGRTAWQFTPGSAVELAYLLARVVEQPKRAQELKDAAAEYFRRHHSVGELVERLLTLYRAAIGAPETGGDAAKRGDHDGA